MDVFSGIKNVQNSMVDHKMVNGSENQLHKVHKTPEAENKELMDKKSTEDIKKELQHLTEKLNKEMNPLNKNIEFKYNQKIDNFSVLVIDKSTDKVIREFPPKDAIKLMEKMRELVGMLFDKKG